MKKLSPKGQRVLKLLHLFFMSMWVGAAIIINVKQFFIDPHSDGELYGIMATLHFIDFFIIIPGAIGVLLTSVIYSIWTPWGWFKHKWITVKWLICIFSIVFGTYPLGPWLTEMTVMTKDQGLGALSNEVFLHHQRMLYIFGSMQGLLLLFAVYLSAIKPWKKRK